MSETETIDKLFLELSQVSKAKTGRELALEKSLARVEGMIKRLRDTLKDTMDRTEDHGDYVAFGSTNDADAMREIANLFDAHVWDRVMKGEKVY